ncbi:hypothetical protein ACP70R_010029 [Stipagrostis hirtigluma subsp. patula]
MEGAISSPPNTRNRIAVVTGGNKGIGLEVCRQLAGDGVTVVLTARDEKRGAGHRQAQRSRALRCHFPSAGDYRHYEHRSVNNAAIVGVEYFRDPTDPSISSGEKFSGMDAPQRLEWMLSSCREPYDAAKEGVQTNYYGTKHVIEALLPLLQASTDGRIVNVSSDYGLLRLFGNEKLKQELNNVESLTEERLDEVLDMFLKDFKTGEAEARGWPTRFGAYKVAKAAMNAYSRVLARRYPELRVNCAHPGYVRTDMTVNSGVLTPEEGAANVATVALLPAGGPTGAYFALDKEASFV